MENKKKEAIDPIQLYYMQKWCPLFGPLPEIDHGDYLQEKCIEIICEARHMWAVDGRGGIPYGLTSKDYSTRPEPHQVPEYPPLLLSTARGIFDPHLSTIQHTLDPSDNIERKLRKAIDFVRDLHWGYEFDYDTLDYAIIAMFALAEAWDVLVCVLEEGVSEDNPGLLRDFQVATSLLAIAKEMFLKPDAERGKKILLAAMKGQEERKKTKQELWDKWQIEANRIWEVNPGLSKNAVARLIANKLKESEATSHLIADQQTIRKKIQRPVL